MSLDIMSGMTLSSLSTEGRLISKDVHITVRSYTAPRDQSLPMFKTQQSCRSSIAGTECLLSFYINDLSLPHGTRTWLFVRDTFPCRPASFNICEEAFRGSCGSQMGFYVFFQPTLHWSSPTGIQNVAHHLSLSRNSRIILESLAKWRIGEPLYLPSSRFSESRSSPPFLLILLALRRWASSSSLMACSKNKGVECRW